MILALDMDMVLYLFDSVEQAEQKLEAIDIENHEYEFCDDKGLLFVAEMTTPVSALRCGSFKLIPANTNPHLPNVFVKKARELGMSVEGIDNLEDLKNRLDATE